MHSRILSFVLSGIDDSPCEVEVDINDIGLPKTTVVGLPDAAVKESMERVRSAICNTGYSFPDARLLVNLAPADIRKEGPMYDVPIAIGFLVANGTIRPPSATPRAHESCTSAESVADVTSLDFRQFLFAGELALDGRIRPISGAIAMALHAKRSGHRGVILPKENAREAAAVEGIEVYGVSSLSALVAMLNGQADELIQSEIPVDYETLVAEAVPEIDLCEIKGQEVAKRAMLIAVAGGHNILMIGPPGTGKTMLAKSLPGLLPPLTRQEALDVTRIYSSCGLVENGSGLRTLRPYRAPHHTASSAAIIGGGSIPRPGEVSLAHRGVLFLDEMPEFARPVLETLRQPMEDGYVTISRAHSTLRFPADFMLVAAINPTPRGMMPDDPRTKKIMQQYLSRISGPMIDRIDIHVEVPAIPFDDLRKRPTGEPSSKARKLVLTTRKRQMDRQGEAVLNANLGGKLLDAHASLDDDGMLLLKQAVTELGLSARGYDKIRRVARTIADLDGIASIEVSHVAEAIQYRLLDRIL